MKNEYPLVRRTNIKKMLLYIFIIVLLIFYLTIPVNADTYNIGDHIFYGEYEQDNNILNGEEPIEWIIIDKDECTITAISLYGLDNVIYHSIWIPITWEKSDIRKWLNTIFYDESFTDVDKEYIMKTYIIASSNKDFNSDPGESTYDYVYFLSDEEAEMYFKTDEERICYPTEYAKSKGVYASVKTGGCWWWLRTPGNRNTYIEVVKGDGRIYRHGHYMIGSRLSPSDGAFRPVIKIWIGENENG